MNGASAVPWARKSRPLMRTSSTTIGASHSFFLSRMNAQSSLITDSTIWPPLELPLHTRRCRQRRVWSGSSSGGQIVLSVIRELWAFMRERKKLWLAPIVVLLVLISGLLFLAQGTALAPFIYSIF